jgi:C2c1 CRISPR-Cas endonuclease, RuvC-like domain
METIRSVRAKLIIPQSDGPRATRLREQLAYTHELMHEAVCGWQTFLLELRQDDVALGRDDDGREIIKPAAAWTEQLVARLGRKTVDRWGDDLKILYGLLMPSYKVRGAGTAQDAVGMIRPLTTPGSRGGLRRFDVLDHFGWLAEAGREKKPRVTLAARRRIERHIEEDPTSLVYTGNTAKWIVRRRKWLAGNADIATAAWPEFLLEEVELKQGQLATDHGVLKRLYDGGVLPLLSPFLTLASSPKVSAWDIAALGLAAAALSSWESKRHEMVENLAQLREALAMAQAGDDAGSAAARRALDELELGLEHPLGGREIWGWRDLRERLRAGERDQADMLAKLVAEHGRRVRSPDVLKQLMRVSAFYTSERDPVRSRVVLNDAVKKLDRAHRLPIYTPAHPTLHPQWIDYDLASSNKPRFNLFQDDAGRVTASIPLLRSDDAGLVEEAYRVGVVPTRQLDRLRIERQDKWVTARFVSQDRLDKREAIVGGSRLMVKPEGVWLKLALKVDLDEEQTKRRLKARTYLSKAPVNRKGPRPDARVLAVDLRVRCVGACSVYGKDGKRERTFLVRLPGEEKVGRVERERRYELDAELARLRGRISEVNRAGRNCLASETAAEKAAVVKAYFDHGTVPVEVVEFFELEEQVGREISALRRGERDVGGKRSMWRVSYLDKLLRLLKSWDRHGRIVEKRQTSREGVGRKLQEHLNALKEDRAKTAADMIVQSALGRVRKGNTWMQKYDPVDVIVVDGLHLYKTNAHLPRGENGQLMRWCHRAISESVQFQAQVATIAVTESATFYSSRFHAVTRAPGTPCRPLTAYDIKSLEQRGDKHWAWKRLKAMGAKPKEIKRLREGDLVPDTAGRLFVTLGPSGPVRLDTAVNAVGNNGQWYLEGKGAGCTIAPFKVRDGLLALPCDGARVKSMFKCRAVTLERVRDGSFALTKHRTLKSAQKVLGVPVPTAGKTVRVFTDPTGRFFRKGRWVEREPFWDRVKQEIVKGLGLVA